MSRTVSQSRAVLAAGLCLLWSPALLGSAVRAEVQAEQTPHAPAVPETTPERVKAALVPLDALAERLIREKAVPGLAVAVVYRDEVVFLKGYGVREMGKADRVTPDTVFQLASLSKPIAATIVSVLVSDGKVAWDDPVSKYLPDFQLSDPWVTRDVTIRDLFSHRSGLPGDAGNELEEMGYDRAEILRRLRFVPPTAGGSGFRAGYSYSNFGLTTGAVAAASAVGKPWEAVADESLYKPLGMTMTSSRYADFAARTNRSHLHIPSGGVSEVGGAWEPRLTRNADAQSPAGGVNSTARDLAQWLRLLVNEGMYGGKRLIASAALRETHYPQIVRGANPATGAPGFYGLGWNIDYDAQGRVFWDHAGAFSVGARTQVKVLPSEKLGIVVLSNAFPTGVPDGIADTFFDFVLRGKPERDWVPFWNGLYRQLVTAMTSDSTKYTKPLATVSAPLPLRSYTGTYSNDYLGRVEIRETNGVLEMLWGPKRTALPLQHWNRDTFLYELAPELPKSRTAITFVPQSDGTPGQVILEGFDGERGVLHRLDHNTLN